MNQFKTSFIGLVIIILISASGGCNQQESTAVGSDQSLVGVWKIISGSQVDSAGQNINLNFQSSVVIFTPKYYSITYAVGDQPRQPATERWNPTDEEKLAAFNSLIVNTGEYENSGSSITFRPQVARSEEFCNGGFAEYEYQINGDTLNLTMFHLVSFDNQELSFTKSGGKFNSTLVRVE